MQRADHTGTGYAVVQAAARGQDATRDAKRAAFFERQNELILNAAGEGIYGLDLDGRVTFANPAAADLTGHAVDELMGQHMHSLVHHTGPDGAPLPRERCAIYAAFADGAVHHVEDELFWRKDGSSFPVRYTSTPIREGGRLVGAVVVFKDISERRAAEAQLRTALAEVGRLKEQLQAENAYLQQEIRAASNFGEIVGSDPALVRALAAARRVAATNTTVLIRGESGTGKELVARLVHEQSARRERPLVKVNCGALPQTLVGSELFGHEKGAFTGAVNQRRGRFELADGGTLFLDEIGELPLETQATLLRVLQDGEFERIGGVQTVRVQVRLIVATHRDLAAMVEAGQFRADLYYRLNVFPIVIPPLRNRLSDLPGLVEAFLGQLSRRFGRPITGLTQGSVERLSRYSFPGNVRELHNLLERAAILASDHELEIGELEDAIVRSSPPWRGEASSSTLTQAPLRSHGPERAVVRAAARVQVDGALDLETRERQHMIAVLHGCHWKIAGQDGAAAVLGLHPNTLRSRMKKLRIPTRRDARRSGAPLG
ncbi:MAG: sigma 54-interacting transcriptional regulator [Myxococcales bacterium]|nr:sigma 54-interacting transcriptional regulator [Myxococcales bacterium]